MEENPELPPEHGYGGTVGESEDAVCFVQDADGTLENTGAVLDEQAIQRLVESGAVGEDSIIAIVHNENGEPQTVVLSKQEAEALGIQIDNVENQAPLAEEEGMAMEAEPSDAVIDELKSAIEDSTMLENESMVEDNTDAVPVEAAAPEATADEPKIPEENTEPQNEHVNGQSEIAGTLQEDTMPEINADLGGEDKTEQPQETNPPEPEKPEAQAAEEGAVPDSDVLSSIIQSLFNPNDANAANVSLVPKIIGGKRKLCLRVPTSTASALLAQSGSPFVTSLHEGGVPKKIKIVIPPSAVSGLSSSSVKSTVAGQETAASQQGLKAAKPFLQSLFNSGPSSNSPATPKVATSTSKPPIQLVQEGSTFRSLQPLTSEQLKHIANVLKQDRESILTGESSAGDKRTQGPRNVIYDKSSNTKIVYRVVQSADDKGDSADASPIVRTGYVSRGRGRRGRPPKYLSAGTPKKPTYTETESEESPDEDSGSLSGQELSKEEREERKKSLQRTRSGRVSKPPRHMMKDYKRLHHLDFAQPDLDDSDGGYSDYQGKGEDADTNDMDAEPEEKVKPTSPIPPSPFHCTACKKEYTTPHRLARHFEQFPSHGDASSLGTPSTSKGVKVDDGEDEDSAPRGRGSIRGGVRGRGRRPRGRPPLVSPAVQAERRRIRLAEALESARDEDVVDVAGPRLAAVMSSWEYLLLRVQQEDEGNSKAALVPRVLKEASALMGKITAVAREYLSTTKSVQRTQSFELKDSKIAAMVGLPCGTYYISKDERNLLRDTLMFEDHDEDSQEPYSGSSLRDEPSEHSQATQDVEKEKAEPETADTQTETMNENEADVSSTMPADGLENNV